MLSCLLLVFLLTVPRRRFCGFLMLFHFLFFAYAMLSCLFPAVIFDHLHGKGLPVGSLLRCVFLYLSLSYMVSQVRFDTTIVSLPDLCFLITLFVYNEKGEDQLLVLSLVYYLF